MVSMTSIRLTVLFVLALCFLSSLRETNHLTLVDAACKADNDQCSYTAVPSLPSLLPDPDCSVLSSFITLITTFFQFNSSCLKKVLGDFNAGLKMNIGTNLNITGKFTCKSQADLVVGSTASGQSATVSAGGDMDLQCYVVGPGTDKKLISFVSESDVSLSYEHSAQNPCFYASISADGDINVAAGIKASCPYVNNVEGASVVITVGSLGTLNSYEASLKASAGPVYVNFDGSLYLNGINSIGGSVKLNCTAGVQNDTSINIKGSIETAVKGLEDAAVELEGKFQSTLATIKQNIKSAKDIIVSNIKKLDVGGKIETIKGDLNITNVSAASINGSVTVNGDLVITWDVTSNLCKDIVIKGNLTVNGNVYFYSKTSGFLSSYCPITVRVEGNFQHTGTVERTGQAQMIVQGSTVPIENKTPGEQGGIIAIVVCCCVAALAIVVFAVVKMRKSKSVPHTALRT